MKRKMTIKMNEESKCGICGDTIEFINVCVICENEICDECTVYPIGDKKPVCSNCNSKSIIDVYVALEGVIEAISTIDDDYYGLTQEECVRDLKLVKKGLKNFLKQLGDN